MTCPPGSLPAPPPIIGETTEASPACLPVTDKRHEFSFPAQPVPLEGHFATAAGGGPDSDPPPEGISDFGTWYLDGTLSATYSATFSAYIEVYPDYDAEEFVGYNDGYYVTGTNRTQKSMEFLARFRRDMGSDPDGWLQIYDWSCSVDDPCDNGYPLVPGTNAFVRAWHLPDYPCYYEMLEDNTGHYVNYVFFRNSSWIVEPRNPPDDPPLWRNAVSIKNTCTGEYDGCL